jgi:hypothetical protein
LEAAAITVNVKPERSGSELGELANWQIGNQEINAGGIPERNPK